MDVHIGSPREIKVAVGKALRAFATWSTLTAEERSRKLLDLATLIRENATRLATIECSNVGKTYQQCVGEILRGAENFEFFATEILHASDDTFHRFSGRENILSFTKQYPVGVVGQIVPWNSPFVLGTWNIAPALAYGNTVVMKPSLWAPCSLMALGELARQVGIPDGVLNIVPGGNEAGETLVRHAYISRVAFTGSAKVGRLVQIANAETRFAPVSLELGGKSANIVFGDADMDDVPRIAWSIFRSQGQSCVAGARVLVEESIFDAFLACLLAATRKLRIGDPMDPKNDFGPLINETHLTNVLGSIQSGKEAGATLVCGGNRIDHTGTFLEPTIFTGVTPTMRIFQEEIFGPVLCITTFKDEAEAIHLANATRYGLSSNVWTQDVKRALRVADRVNAGMIWVNGHFVRDLRAPFGGTKESGVGRQGARHSREFYTDEKMTCVTY